LLETIEFTAFSYASSQLRQTNLQNRRVELRTSASFSLSIYQNVNSMTLFFSGVTWWSTTKRSSIINKFITNAFITCVGQKRFIYVGNGDNYKEHQKTCTEANCIDTQVIPRLFKIIALYFVLVVITQVRPTTYMAWQGMVDFRSFRMVHCQTIPLICQ